MNSYNMDEDNDNTDKLQTRDQTKTNKHININILTSEHHEMKVDLDLIPAFRITENLEQFNTSNENNIESIK